MAVGKGNDARSGAASKMRGRAFVMTMVGRPAVSTAPVIGAVTGLMSRVFAMASEAVNVRGESTLPLAERSPWRGPWVLHPSTLQAIFTFTFSRVIVRGSLCCEDAGDDAAGRAPWPGAYQVRGKACSCCCMGEISLHLVLLFFCLQLLSP